MSLLIELAERDRRRFHFIMGGSPETFAAIEAVEAKNRAAALRARAKDGDAPPNLHADPEGAVRG
jgi:hypothetical protein